MIKIDTSELVKAAAQLKGLERHARIAMLAACTRTAKRIKGAVVEEMKREFDRPTPMTLNSIMVKPATDSRPYATVWLKDREIGGKQLKSMAEVIGHQFKGGPRTEKRIEMRLRRMGILPSGMYVVPGRGANLDAYGNMRRGDISKMLTQLGAFAELGIKTMSDRTYAKLTKTGTLAAHGSGKGRKVLRREFIVKNGVGIWQVKGKGIVEPFIVFARRPNYRQRIDFHGVGQRVADEYLVPEFHKAFAEAMASSGFKGKWK